MLSRTEQRSDAMDPGIISWRYLRLAIVALGLGLFAAVLWEQYLTPNNCIQGSISAYFYTPARGMFTGALVAIGVCLFSVRGSTPLEDTFLNFAGIFAPMVALIPTPRDDLDKKGVPIRPDCAASYAGTSGGRVEGYTNAMVAYFVVGAFALLLLIVVTVSHRIRKHQWDLTRGGIASWVVGLLVLIIGWWIFAKDRYWFDANMHKWSAILMFVFAWFVIGCDTFDHLARQMGWKSWRGFYLFIFLAMLVVAVAIGAAHAYGGWNQNWIYWLEFGEIVPFLLFWAGQSIHMWSKPVRP